MAAPSHLLRSVGCRLNAFNRVLREGRALSGSVPCSRVPVVCCPVRLQHTDSVTTNVGEPTGAAEAEKTPVVIDNDAIMKMMKDMDENNMPFADMPDPYQKEHKRCILCVHNVEVNYKNVRLLSQFVSPHTGRIYGRAVTGLCIPMQKEVARAIKQSRAAGFMPYMLKKSEYLKDPRLFDPFKTVR